MTYKIFEAGQDKEAALFIAAADKALGYPIEYALDDPRVKIPAWYLKKNPDYRPVTESCTCMLAHADGRIAVLITDEIRSVDGLKIEIEDDGKPVEVTVDATATHAEVPRSRPEKANDVSSEWVEVSARALQDLASEDKALADVLRF